MKLSLAKTAFLFCLVLLLSQTISVKCSAQEDYPRISGLSFIEETPLTYAEGFRIFRYEGGYSLICIQGGERFLVIPEGASDPEISADGITLLHQPLDRIYLAATSAMSLFDALDSVDHIRLTGTQASGWYIDSAKNALSSGDMLFAGRYSEPDYELMLTENCCLAIESTMIYHTPKIREMIEDLGIPVLVDRASYESHPLGRTEWIKLYAVLCGKEAEADAFFDEQAAVIELLKDFPNTEKNIAYFYVNSDGSIVIRNPDDYVPKMITLGGGKYIAPPLLSSETGTSVSVTMESFYAACWDADYLIYNSSIDMPLENRNQLIAKDALFADFKAVQEGNVWCTGKSFYQATDIVGQMIRDINIMLTSEEESSMTFLTRVK